MPPLYRLLLLHLRHPRVPPPTDRHPPHPAAHAPVADEHRLPAPLDGDGVALCNARHVHLQRRHRQHIRGGLWGHMGWGVDGNWVLIRGLGGQRACLALSGSTAAAAVRAACALLIELSKGSRCSNRTHGHGEDELEGQQARRGGVEEAPARLHQHCGGDAVRGGPPLVVGLVVPNGGWMGRPGVSGLASACWVLHMRRHCAAAAGSTLRLMRTHNCSAHIAEAARCSSSSEHTQLLEQHQQPNP